MADVGVKITGTEGVLAGLAEKSIAAGLGVVDGINTTAMGVQRDAKRKATVDTGRLRSSIGFDPATQANPEARVETNVHYAEHVEFGTTTQQAQPFMRPAIETNMAKHADNIAASIKRRLGA